MTNLIGETIGRFRVDKFIGRGNVGTVYEATETDIGRKVALKQMESNTAVFQSTHLPIIQKVASFTHPTIATTYDIISNDAGNFIVSDLADERLQRYLDLVPEAERRPQLEEILRLIAQAAKGLAHGHKRDLIHGHVNLNNLLLKKLDTPDRADDPLLRVMITDFGLVQRDEWDVFSRPFLDMIRYWSPEQCRGEPGDGRSDLYSLGILLFHLVTGRRPFKINSLDEATTVHSLEQVPSVTAVRDDVPRAIDDIIQKATAKEPAQRFQTGDELAQALREMADALKSGTVDTTAYFTWQGQDQLHIMQENQLVEEKRLIKPTITIGAAEENDIILPHNDVSPQHAELHRSEVGWQVIDLNSRDGTFIDGIQLLQNRLEDWETTQTLRIGPYTMSWSRGERPAAPPPGTVDRDSIEKTILVQDLGIRIEPKEITVEAGDRAEMRVELFNRGGRVVKFEIQILSIPYEWVTLSQRTVQMLPEERQNVQVIFHPPREQTAAAGTHPFQVGVHAEHQPGQTAIAGGWITIRPFYKLLLDLQPKRFVNEGETQLTIWNDGNSEIEGMVEGRDPAQALQFGDAQPYQLAPGTETRLTIPIRAKEKRPLMGRRQPNPFTIVVHSEDAEPAEENGQLDIKPIIPAWVLILLITLLTIACIVISIIVALT